LVLGLVLLTFSAMKIAPMLSTQTIMGNSTSIPMESMTWMMNLFFFVASDRATNSASFDDNVTLC